MYIFVWDVNCPLKGSCESTEDQDLACGPPTHTQRPAPACVRKHPPLLVSLGKHTS